MRGAGQVRWMASNTAHPGSTKPARSAPTQGCAASAAGDNARSRATACSAWGALSTAPSISGRR